MALDVGQKALDRFGARRHLGAGVEEAPVDLGEDIRGLVGGAAEHHAVDVLQVRVGLVERRDAAVDDDGQLRVRRLEPVDARVVERRHLAVLLRRQTLQPRLARMHDEGAHAGGGDDIDEALQVALAILLVDADAALDGHRNFDLPLHGGDAGRDKLRLGHQAGAEAALLHAVRRAADIEVDLVVAVRLADRRCLGERDRIGAAELQRHGMLDVVHAEQARAVAVQDGRRGHHLGVEPRVARQLAVEGPAVPVRPVHHRSDREPMRLMKHRFSCSLSVHGREHAQICSHLFSSLPTFSHLPCARFVHADRHPM